MTTRESKGRFFLLNESIRIDSHNESNRFELRIGMLYCRLSDALQHCSFDTAIHLLLHNTPNFIVHWIKHN